MKKFGLIFIGFLFAGLLQGQVANGLIAKYYFNEGTFEDEVGDVDGVPSNTYFAHDRFMNPGIALGFDMNEMSNVSFGDNFDEVFATPDSTFSFSFWFKTQDTSNTNVLMISKYGNVNCWEDQREFFIRINGNKQLELLYFTILGIENYRSVYTTMLIEDTLWHHAVFNYDGSLDGNDGQNRVEIYLDNVKQETQLSSTGILGDIQNGTAHLSLGVPLGSTGNICGGSYFDGVMDDIRLYNRTLSDAEVDTLYNEENPFSSIEEMIINPTVFYPNPAGNFITLDISMDKFDEIAIYSLHGQELRRFSSGSSTINISSLAEGIYIISIFKDKEWILSQKLVVGFH